MQTLHRLRRFRDLRAVSPGARPPADGAPSPALVPPDQEARPAFLSRGSARSAASWPTFAVGSRPAAPAALLGTGPESGAVPRGHPCQRAIRFRLSRERARLPDRVCRALLVRQTTAHPGDGPAHHRQHGRPPVGVAACLPGWQADRLAVCISASLPDWQSASLCPSPDR